MGTTTTNLGLYKPAIGETGWGALVDATFDKLDGSSAVFYVATTGSDANTGTSWGDAKLTVKAAIDALPSNGGKIYCEDGVWAQADHSKGLWLTSSGTSGYITSKPFILEGAGNLNNGLGLSAGAPIARINVPSTDVGIKWDSAATDSFSQLFRHIGIASSSVAVRASVTDAGARHNADNGVQNKAFEYCSFDVNQSAGYGPTVDLGGNIFWWWFRNCILIGNEYETYTSEKRCAVRMDPGTTSTPGLVFMDGCNFAGGSGVLVRPGPTGGLRLRLKDITTEGTTGGPDGAASQQPALDVVDGAINGSPSYKGSVIVDSVVTADSNYTNPAVRIFSGIDPAVVQVGGVDSVQGPCTLLGTSTFEKDTTDGSVSNTLREQRQRGWGRNSVLVGQVDAARRQSPLAAASHANLAPQDTATWSGKTGSATVTTGQADLFGGTGAAKLSSGAGSNNRQIYRAVRAVSVGDWLIGGCWVRGDTADVTMFASGAGVTIGTAGGTGVTTLTSKVLIQSIVPRKQWQWVPVASKVTAAGTNPEIIFQLGVDTTTAIHYFLPVFCHIPVADGLSDAEVYERIDQLGTWSENVAVGDIGIPKGVALSLNGVRVVTGTLTPEGAVTAPPGSLFLRTDGGASTSLYVKTSGTGNTGWTAK